jgi:hypothetical protein
MTGGGKGRGGYRRASESDGGGGVESSAVWTAEASEELERQLYTAMQTTRDVLPNETQNGQDAVA